MSRFNEINRRCLTLAGDDAVLITENGVRLEVRGTFDDAVYDLEHKAKSNAGNSGLSIQKATPCLSVESLHVEGINKNWRVMVGEREYYVSKHNPDGLGMTTLWLSDAIDSGYGADKDNWL